MLLKSCATPPASWPTASIFWAWRSCSSSARRSLTSRAMPWTPTGRPATRISREATSSETRRPERQTSSHSYEPSSCVRTPHDAPGTSSSRERAAEQVGARVSGDPLAGAVDRGEAAVEVEREDHVVRVLEELAVALLARAQRLLGALALGRVLDHADPELRAAVGVADERDGEARRDRAAVLRAVALLELVVVALALDELRVELAVADVVGGLRVVLDRQRHELLGGVAERALERAVRGQQAAVEADERGAVRRELEHRAEAALALAQERERRERPVRPDERREHGRDDPRVRRATARRARRRGRRARVPSRARGRRRARSRGTCARARGGASRRARGG